MSTQWSRDILHCRAWPFVSDLRTGAMSGGSGEQGLLTAACAQMLRHFDLPGGAASGMADSKMPDAQSGYEREARLSWQDWQVSIWSMRLLACMPRFWFLSGEPDYRQ